MFKYLTSAGFFLVLACGVALGQSTAKVDRNGTQLECKPQYATSAESDPIVAIMLILSDGKAQVVHIAQSGHTFNRADQYNLNSAVWSNNQFTWSGRNNKKSTVTMVGTAKPMTDDDKWFSYTESVFEGGSVNKTYEMFSVCSITSQPPKKEAGAAEKTTPFVMTSLYVLNVLDNTGRLSPALKPDLPEGITTPLWWSQESCLMVRGKTAKPEKYFCQLFKSEPAALAVGSAATEDVAGSMARVESVPPPVFEPQDGEAITQTHPAVQIVPSVKRRFRITEKADNGFLELRSGPGVAYSMIAQMPVGTAGVVGNCVPVETGYLPFCEVEWNGKHGWASSCCMADVEMSGALSAQIGVGTPTPQAQCWGEPSLRDRLQIVHSPNLYYERMRRLGCIK
jgi:hypothetical protein